MIKTCFFGILVFMAFPLNAQTGTNPSFEEVFSLQSAGEPVISPDGNHVVFQVSSTDWKNNQYDTELWISKNGDEPFQLTNSPGNNSYNPKWSPDSKWIAFISKRGEKNQIQIIRAAGGEAIQLTDTDEDISDFEWSPDGRKIAFLQPEKEKEKDKKRKEKYGGFAEDDKEFKLSRLWLIDFDPRKILQWPLPAQLDDSVYIKSREPVAVMDSVDFTITDFQWSPDGEKIAFEHRPDPLVDHYFRSDISIYDLDSESYRILVANQSYDGFMDWSPDGGSIVYSTNLDDTTSNFYSNELIFRIDIDGSNNTQLARDFDENLSGLRWTAGGIFGTAWQRTNRPVVRIDPDHGTISLIENNLPRIWSFSFSSDGKKVAYSGQSDETLTEVYLSDISFKRIRKVTSSSDQIADWSCAKSEVISWPSEDGTMIEGILQKPVNYDPSRKYPLLVIIHGGPAGISVPSPVSSYVYPVVQWLNRGALVLMPNYRGSAGYGEKFRSLNVKNLGVGDAWDVLSGVRHLEDLGMIDMDSVGCMGWSQGGYISAFLTTNTKIFKAISVGAGISDWMTYYVNTDIHPFTRQYLKATPWADREIYERTSPMTNIRNASTPTLIQHGEYDRRVPIANAYELNQGLKDMGVESRLIVYKEFGHGISKPKERLAATWHNWQWFGKYIWGEEIDLPY